MTYLGSLIITLPLLYPAVSAGNASVFYYSNPVLCAEERLAGVRVGVGWGGGVGVDMSRLEGGRVVVIFISKNNKGI